MMKNLNIISYALIFSMLISCRVVSQETPTILNYMCGKLCWNNIIVGTTTREELLSTIRKLANVDQNSISQSKQEGLFNERVYFSFHNNLSSETTIVRVSAYFIDQKVVALDLNDNLGTDLQEVISKFGEPDLVFAIKNHGGQVGITFINSHRGIAFGCVVQNEKSNLKPDTEITRITFFDAALYQELLEADWLLPGYRQFTPYAWDGYGKIEKLYWPPRKP